MNANKTAGYDLMSTGISESTPGNRTAPGVSNAVMGAEGAPFGEAVASMPAAQRAILQNFAVGRVNYWISFGSDSALTLFFLGYEIHARPVSWPVTLLLFFAGLFVWSLSEYVFHRWVYHQEKGIFGS